MEGQRWMFAFTFKFATEDPVVQFYGVIANLNFCFFSVNIQLVKLHINFCSQKEFCLALNDFCFLRNFEKPNIAGLVIKWGGGGRSYFHILVKWGGHYKMLWG